MISGLNNNISIAQAYSRGIRQRNIRDQEKPGGQAADSIDIQVDNSDQTKALKIEEIETDTGNAGKEPLTEEDKRLVARLKKMDRETRAHEKAHLAAGGELVQGGASYTYQRGPDGRMYAVAGEVSIDTSPENDPDATIRKMQRVKRAALAPSHPSGQDRSVAARATQTEHRARIEKLKQNQEDAGNKDHDESHPAAQDATTFYEKAAAQSEEKGLTIDLAV